MKGFRAVIFDAFGTLIDTKDGSVRATQAIFSRYLPSFDAAAVYARWKTIHRGLIRSPGPFRNEAEIFIAGLGTLFTEMGIPGDPVRDIRPMLESLMTRTPYEDAARAIEKLRTVARVCVASNSDDAPLLANLHRIPVTFDVVLSSEKLRAYKPSGRFFEGVLAEIGLSPREVVYVGDSQEEDVVGAQNAQIPVVWLNRTSHTPLPGIPSPQFTAQNLDECSECLLSRQGFDQDDLRT
ncbi:MAG: HAD-IA family hydrolase [Candidatus Coatesbacteria bacterium]